MDTFLFMTNLEISLPSSHQNERDKIEIKSSQQSNKAMHIGGFNFLQQNKAATVEGNVATSNGDIVGSTSVLKEFNKNSTSDNFKLNKKYKFGHVNKSFEPSSAYGM